MTILTAILIIGGVFFLIVSCVGLLRLPDVYTRAHAVGKSETLGALLVLAGLAIYNGLAISTLKILVILVFIVIANPTATHAILRAALRSGLEPWTRAGKNNSGSSSDAKSLKSEKSEAG